MSQAASQGGEGGGATAGAATSAAPQAFGLTGRWKKDKQASDPMDEAMDMVALPWLLRQALALLNYLELEESEAGFKTVLKAGKIFDIVEQYPWSGEVREYPRRDKRRGKHRGYVERTEPGPCIICECDDPYGLRCSDTFELSPCGTRLTQHTEMTSKAGHSIQYKTVFNRVR